MKLAYSSNAYMKYTVEEAIDRIAALGFAGMELMADVPHAWPGTITEEQIDAIRRRLDRRRLILSNVNAFMMNAVGDFRHPSWLEADPSLRRKRAQHTIDALTLARKLGAPCITTEPGGPLEKGMSRDQAMDTFVDELSPILRHAEEVGVQLLVEPEPGLLIENADQFLALADRVDSPMFGLNFDMGHFYCVGEPLPESIERLKHHTRHVHVEDIAASRVHKHLIPGHGAIDFASALSALRATGYEGWLTIELYPYLDDPDGAGREAKEHLTRWLAK